LLKPRFVPIWLDLDLAPIATMSYFLPHLPTGWHVDQAILSEEDRVVVIRFGHDWDSQCMKMDETLNSVSEKVQNFAVIYLVDITQVPDFNKVCCAAPYGGVGGDEADFGCIGHGTA
jgi:thiol-disulfide isomerase/thioredoxin